MFKAMKRKLFAATSSVASHSRYALTVYQCFSACLPTQTPSETTELAEGYCVYLS